MSMIFSSGIYFLLADATELINESGKITYMLYLKSGTNIAVPFKAGNIVEVDLYPFADKRIIGIHGIK